MLNRDKSVLEANLSVPISHSSDLFEAFFCTCLSRISDGWNRSQVSSLMAQFAQAKGRNSAEISNVNSDLDTRLVSKFYGWIIQFPLVSSQVNRLETNVT